MQLLSKLRHRLALAVISTVAITTAQGAAAVTILKNFTLIDGTGHVPVSASALIIGDDGHLAWVGLASQLKVPEGGKVVDLMGKFVMPGLIDAHVHIGVTHDQDEDAEDVKDFTPQIVHEDLRTYAAYGVTTVETLGSDKDWIFDLRRQQRTGRPTEARVYTAGQGFQYVGGYGGVKGLTVPTVTVDQAIKQVDELAAKGVDVVKFWIDDEFHSFKHRMPYAMTGAIIREAHLHHLKVAAHVYYLDDAKEVVAQGVDGLAHEVRDQPVDDALINSMKAHGTWQFAATLGREAAYSFAVMPWLNDPFFVRGVTPGTMKVLESPNHEKAMLSTPADQDWPCPDCRFFAGRDGVFKNAFENFALEVKAGIPYGMGTDSGPPLRFPGFNAHEELYLMVLSGITPMQAIVAATGANAKWLGAKDIGTIAAGNWADLLILDADPLNDIRNTRTIDSVYIAGNLVPTIWQICRGRPASACTGGPKSSIEMPY